MLNQLVDSIKESGIKAFGLEAYNLICLFDDDYYSNIDYDFVSNQHRTVLRAHLIGKGWNPKSSRIFTKDSIEVVFPKPTGVLGTDPSDSVAAEMKTNRYIFCTPSQALLIMAKTNRWDQNLAQQMIKDCPANVDKVYQWMKEYKLVTPTKAQLSELKKFQSESFNKKVQARKNSGL
jgi:hypothetical protein